MKRTYLFIMLMLLLTTSSYLVVSGKTLGYDTPGISQNGLRNRIRGTLFSTQESGYISSLTFYLDGQYTGLNKQVQGMVYDQNGNLIGKTSKHIITVTANTLEWYTMSVEDQIQITEGHSYYLVVWSNSDSISLKRRWNTAYDFYTEVWGFDETPPNTVNLEPSISNWVACIYANYTTETPTPPKPQPSTNETIRFAILGDHGGDNDDCLAVANLIKSWDVDFIITTGDNNNLGPNDWYRAVGQYYDDEMSSGDFYPTIGNHDDYLEGGISSYLDYFDLPGNERYYDFTRGPVHFTCINSYSMVEPDLVSPTGTQADWVRSSIDTSDAPWEVAYFHHTAYSSGTVHSNEVFMRDWNFGGLVDVVFSGHEHNYERVNADGITFFTNGVGGVYLYGFGEPIEGSQVRLSTYGAQLVTANSSVMNIKFYDLNYELLDNYTIYKDPPPPEPTYYDLTLVNVDGVTYELPAGVHTFEEGTVVKITLYLIMDNNYIFSPSMEPQP